MAFSYYALVVAVSYLLGSLPSGYLVGKAHGKDLRKEGSGNIGATNAVRVLGKKWGYVVFAMDFLKGCFAVRLAIGGYFLVHPAPTGEDASICGILAAVVCILGHIFPVWLKFKGGKGIATAAGIILALFPLVAFVASVSAWVILFFVTRYVSVASIGGSSMLPFSLTVLYILHLGQVDLWLVGTGVVMAIMTVGRHWSNIRRLMNGTEPRFARKGELKAS